MIYFLFLYFAGSSHITSLAFSAFFFGPPSCWVMVLCLHRARRSVETRGGGQKRWGSGRRKRRGAGGFLLRPSNRKCETLLRFTGWGLDSARSIRWCISHCFCLSTQGRCVAQGVAVVNTCSEEGKGVHLIPRQNLGAPGGGQRMKLNQRPANNN